MSLTTEQEEQLQESAKSIEVALTESFNKDVIPLVQTRLEYENAVTVTVDVTPEIVEETDGGITVRNNISFDFIFDTEFTDDAELQKQTDFIYVFENVVQSVYNQ